MRGGGRRPFGIFPKIHPVWYRDPSLRGVVKTVFLRSGFFIELLFFDTLNAFYLIVRGPKNAFFMSFTPLLYRYATILWQSNSKQSGGMVILVVRLK